MCQRNRFAGPEPLDQVPGLFQRLKTIFLEEPLVDLRLTKRFRPFARRRQKLDQFVLGFILERFQLAKRAPQLVKGLLQGATALSSARSGHSSVAIASRVISR